jgi:hypothetical protein
MSFARCLYKALILLRAEWLPASLYNVLLFKSAVVETFRSRTLRDADIRTPEPTALRLNQSWNVKFKPLFSWKIVTLRRTFMFFNTFHSLRFVRFVIARLIDRIVKQNIYCLRYGFLDATCRRDLSSRSMSATGRRDLFRIEWFPRPRRVAAAELLFKRS